MVGIVGVAYKYRASRREASVRKSDGHRSVLLMLAAAERDSLKDAKSPWDDVA
jgi:hypothetical protein